LAQLIEWPGCRFHLDEMQIEENAGLGFGVSVLLLVSVVGAIFIRKTKYNAGSTWQTCVRWSPLVSLAAVLVESNVDGIARILTPYYALLIPVLIAVGGHERLVKK